MGNSGGAAAHAGVDFQERIAALVMAQMLAGSRHFSSLQLSDDVEVTNVAFETKDEVDDLVLTTSGGMVYIQAKRSVSLSTTRGSDFVNTIRQFVSQQLKKNVASDVFMLATSRDSSRKVTQELRRLVEAIRLSELSAANPLTRSEQDVEIKVRAIAGACHQDIGGQPMADEFYQQLLRKIRVVPLDIEAGGSQESAVLILLAAHAKVGPAAIWGTLVAFAVSLAKGRLSIDARALREKMGSYIGTARLEGASVATPTHFEFVFDDQFSSARDLVLVKSLVENVDYLVMELFRFEADGSRRVRYAAGEMNLLDGTKLRVIHRTATYAGMERFLKNWMSDEKSNASLVILAAKDSDEEHTSAFVAAHRQMCQVKLEASARSLLCVRCGEPVSESPTPSIEIDQEDEEHQVGLCHSRCLLPLDRVVGLLHSEMFTKNSSLKNFKYERWFDLLPRGQGLYSGMRGTPGLKTVLWNGEFSKSSIGDWCVRIDLEDGASLYAQERQRVVRMTKSQAQVQATELASAFLRSIEAGDPWCVTSDTRHFAQYSTIIARLNPGQRIIKCERAVVARYSASIGASYSHSDNFYTPLMMLIDEETGAPAVLGGAVFFISDPMVIDAFLENWRRAGFKIQDFVVSILESDADFDVLFRQMRDKRLGVIVDAVMDSQGVLVQGYAIKSMEEELARSADRAPP